MNYSRSNLVLAGLALVLAVPTGLQIAADADTFVDVGNLPLLFDGFTVDNVGQLLLAQPKKEQPPADPANPQQPPKVAYDQIVLQKTDKGWVLAAVPGQDLAGAPVNKERVESDVLLHLRSIRKDRESLVQPNATPAQLEQFGLDEAHAFVVRAIDPSGTNAVAELLVGRDAGAGQTGTEAVRGVFVRKRDSTDVLLYELDKGWLRSVQQDQWLDRMLAKLDVDKVQKLTFRNAASGAQPFTFQKLDGKSSWTAIEPPAGLGAVRQSEVEALVQRFRWIQAQDFKQSLQRTPNLAQLGLQPPQSEFELVVREGDRERSIKLSVGNKLDDKNEYYLLCSEAPNFLMTWPAGTVASFELDVRTQLFDPVAPPAPQGGAEPPAGKDAKPAEIRK